MAATRTEHSMTRLEAKTAMLDLYFELAASANAERPALMRQWLALSQATDAAFGPAVSTALWLDAVALAKDMAAEGNA